MAEVYIYPVAVYGNSWQAVNGSIPAILYDSDVGTYMQNHPSYYTHYFQGYTTASMPSNFVGATITGVYIYADFGYTQNDYGTFNLNMSRPGVGFTAVKGLSAPVTPGWHDVTSLRPGGGSWLYTDFFQGTSSLFGITSNGDAAGSSYYARCAEIYMRVTYTPVSAPTAAFTVSTTTGTSPLTVQFTDQGTNSPTSWLWTFGDSSTSTTQHPLKIYTTVGTYTVTLTETNGGGTASISTGSLIRVTAAATPVVATFTAAPTSGVQNLSVDFSDLSTGTPAPSSWSWNFGDSSTSTSQHPTHVYTTVGTYTVTLTASNTTPSTSTATRASYITVGNGKPVPSFTVSTITGPKPLTVSFTGTATNAVPTSWAWDFGDGGSSVAQSPSHVYSSVGTYTPTLTVGNAIGTASTTSTLEVGYQTATASFTASPLEGFGPHTVRFTDLSQGDVNSWLWSFGDGSTSSSQHPEHTYAWTTASTYDPTKTVTLTAGPVNAAATSSLNSTLTATDLVCVAPQRNSWGLFLHELKHVLFEADNTLCAGFTPFGGAAQVVKLADQRLRRFVLETGALRKEATLTAAAANSEDFTLPADVIEVLRVEVDGVPFYPADKFQQDRTTLVGCYILNDALTLTLPGTFGTTPTVKVMYSYCPDAPSTFSPCACPDNSTFGSLGFFPLPYVLWWIIRYGVLADLLSQPGEKNDPSRAAKFEELFTTGVQIFNLVYKG